MARQYVKGKLQKIEGEPGKILQQSTFRSHVDQLEPGVYEIIVRPLETRLKQMKKAYFAMESELARHLGYKKVHMHEALKPHIGHKICESTGQPVYESVAEIESEDEMMVRIIEFQEMAALKFQYAFPLYVKPE